MADRIDTAALRRAWGETIEATAQVFYERALTGFQGRFPDGVFSPWQDLSECVKEGWRDTARKAFAYPQWPALLDRIDALEAVLTFLADCPDPGAEEERTAQFYRIHAAMLKQIAAKAVGRQVVSDEAMRWAEEWWNSAEGIDARTALGDPS